MRAQQLAAHLDGGVLRNGANAIEGAAPAHAADDLAFEHMLVAAGDSRGVAFRVGMRQHGFLDAELAAGGGLRRGARRHLHTQFLFEGDVESLGVVEPPVLIDRHAAEADEIDARRLHLARRAQADFVGVV